MLSGVPDPSPEPPPDQLPLGRLVSLAGGAVRDRYRRTVARHGVTGTALGVLGVLRGDGGLSQREVAGRAGVTPATLTPVLDALEREGRIRRERDRADRRVVRLWITDDGLALLRSVLAEVAVAYRDRMPHPPPDQERIIRDYLLAVLTATGRDPGPEPED